MAKSKSRTNRPSRASIAPDDYSGITIATHKVLRGLRQLRIAESQFNEDGAPVGRWEFVRNHIQTAEADFIVAIKEIADTASDVPVKEAIRYAESELYNLLDVVTVLWTSLANGKLAENSVCASPTRGTIRIAIDRGKTIYATLASCLEKVAIPRKAEAFRFIDFPINVEARS